MPEKDNQMPAAKNTADYLIICTSIICASILSNFCATLDPRESHDAQYVFLCSFGKRNFLNGGSSYQAVWTNVCGPLTSLQTPTSSLWLCKRPRKASKRSNDLHHGHVQCRLFSWLCSSLLKLPFFLAYQLRGMTHVRSLTLHYHSSFRWLSTSGVFNGR